MKEKSKKTTPKESNYVDTLESTDVSSVFFSHYNKSTNPLENKKISGIIDNFVSLFQRSLSAFLGKKMELGFNSSKFSTVSELNITNPPYILSSVRFAPQNLSGLVFFDYAFIHTIIDILYGAGNYKSDVIISNLGNLGMVIAKKIIELCMASLQEAISEYEKTQITHLKTTEQTSLILNQPLSDQFFDLTFHADFNGVNCLFHIAIPDALFEEMTIKEDIETIENQEPLVIKNTIKKDIIDSTVTLIASLQEIKLSITDIMNLKSGDVIPIHDPTIVYLSHNQKVIFKASVGQLNSSRVVKILDTLS